MKRIVFLVLCCVMLGCTSIDRKAEKLISKFVRENFNNPDSYELIEFKVDTLKDVYMLPEIYSEGIELYAMFDNITVSSMQEKCEEVVEYSQNRNKYLMLGFKDLAMFENQQALDTNYELLKDTKKYIDLCLEVDSLKNSVQLTSGKYLIYHKFRYLDSEKGKILKEEYYLADSTIEKIEFVYNAGTYEVIKALLGSDLKEQIKGVESYYKVALQINDMLLDFKNKL